MRIPIDLGHVFRFREVHRRGCIDCDYIWDRIQAWTELLLWGIEEEDE